MSTLDKLIRDAVDRSDLPFAVAGVVNADGLLWQGAAGRSNETHEAGQDTLFRAFSMTKAIGSVAALILVERGQLTMDTSVASVLPEWKQLQVLESIGPHGPVFRAPRTEATLRHLLTHTSGLAYNTFHPKQLEFQALPGSPDVLNGTVAGFDYPLMFDPGTEFMYGIGIDWVGRMVEAIDGRTIDRFCQDEIFDPLGMHRTTFEAGPHRSRLADIKLRGEDGSLQAIEYEMPAHPEAYGMGHAIYTTAADYLRFLQMILRRGEVDGRRLLGDQAMNLLSSNQLGDQTVPILRSVLPVVSTDIDYFPEQRPRWTAAFMLNEYDIAGRRSAGSLSWSGVLNTQYWIDPKNNLAAVLMTQLLPFCDPRFMSVYEEFERETYKTFASR